MGKKRKKESWEYVCADRYLVGEKKENLYITCLMYFLIFTMSLILVFVSFVSLVEVKGSSMEHTLVNQQHVLLFRNPKSVDVEDIIVIRVADETDPLIKRVIGVEGETICFRVNKDNSKLIDLYKKSDNSEYIRIDEQDYIMEPMRRGDFTNKSLIAENDAEMEKKGIEIGEGFIFFMGDNRNDSKDSRFYGVQPISQITGRMLMKLKTNSILEFLLVRLYGAPSNN